MENNSQVNAKNEKSKQMKLKKEKKGHLNSTFSISSSSVSTADLKNRGNLNKYGWEMYKAIKTREDENNTRLAAMELAAIDTTALGSPETTMKLANVNSRPENNNKSTLTTMSISMTPIELQNHVGVECSNCKILNKEVSDLKEQFQENFKIIKKKMFSTSELIKEFHQKGNELEECKKRLADMNIKLGKAYKETGTTRLQLEKALQANEPHKRTIQRMENEKSLADSELQGYKKKMEKSEAHLEQLKNKITSCRIDNQDVQNKKAESFKLLTKEQSKVLKQGTIIDKLNKKLNDTQGHNRAERKALKMLTRENEKLKMTLETLRGRQLKKKMGAKTRGPPPDGFLSPSPSPPPSPIYKSKRNVRNCGGGMKKNIGKQKKPAVKKNVVEGTDLDLEENVDDDNTWEFENKRITRSRAHSGGHSGGGGGIAQQNKSWVKSKSQHGGGRGTHNTKDRVATRTDNKIPSIERPESPSSSSSSSSNATSDDDSDGDDKFDELRKKLTKYLAPQERRFHRFGRLAVSPPLSPIPPSPVPWKRGVASSNSVQPANRAALPDESRCSRKLNNSLFGDLSDDLSDDSDYDDNYGGGGGGDDFDDYDDDNDVINDGGVESDDAVVKDIVERLVQTVSGESPHMPDGGDGTRMEENDVVEEEHFEISESHEIHFTGPSLSSSTVVSGEQSSSKHTKSPKSKKFIEGSSRQDTHDRLNTIHTSEETARHNVIGNVNKQPKKPSVGEAVGEKSKPPKIPRARKPSISEIFMLTTGTSGISPPSLPLTDISDSSQDTNIGGGESIHFDLSENPLPPQNVDSPTSQDAVWVAGSSLLDVPQSTERDEVVLPMEGLQTEQQEDNVIYDTSEPNVATTTHLLPTTAVQKEECTTDESSIQHSTQQQSSSNVSQAEMDKQIVGPHKGHLAAQLNHAKQQSTINDKKENNKLSTTSSDDSSVGSSALTSDVLSQSEHPAAEDVPCASDESTFHTLPVPRDILSAVTDHGSSSTSTRKDETPVKSQQQSSVESKLARVLHAGNSIPVKRNVINKTDNIGTSSASSTSLKQKNDRRNNNASPPSSSINSELLRVISTDTDIPVHKIATDSSAAISSSSTLPTTKNNETINKKPLSPILPPNFARVISTDETDSQPLSPIVPPNFARVISTDENDTEVAEALEPHRHSIAAISPSLSTPPLQSTAESRTQPVATTTSSVATTAASQRSLAASRLLENSLSMISTTPTPVISPITNPSEPRRMIARRHSMFTRESVMPKIRSERRRTYSPLMSISPPLSPIPPSPRRNVLTPLISPLPTTPLPDSISPLPPSPKITSPPLIRGSALVQSENSSVRMPVPVAHKRSTAVQAITFVKQSWNTKKPEQPSFLKSFHTGNAMPLIPTIEKSKVLQQTRSAFSLQQVSQANEEKTKDDTEDVADRTKCEEICDYDVRTAKINIEKGTVQQQRKPVKRSRTPTLASASAKRTKRDVSLKRELHGASDTNKSGSTINEKDNDRKIPQSNKEDTSVLPRDVPRVLPRRVARSEISTGKQKEDPVKKTESPTANNQQRHKTLLSSVEVKHKAPLSSAEINTTSSDDKNVGENRTDIATTESKNETNETPIKLPFKRPNVPTISAAGKSKTPAKGFDTQTAHKAQKADTSDKQSKTPAKSFVDTQTAHKAQKADTSDKQSKTPAKSFDTQTAHKSQKADTSDKQSKAYAKHPDIQTDTLIKNNFLENVKVHRLDDTLTETVNRTYKRLKADLDTSKRPNAVAEQETAKNKLIDSSKAPAKHADSTSGSIATAETKHAPPRERKLPVKRPFIRRGGYASTSTDDESRLCIELSENANEESFTEPRMIQKVSSCRDRSNRQVGESIKRMKMEASAQPISTPLKPIATSLKPIATPLKPIATPLKPIATPLKPISSPRQSSTPKHSAGKRTDHTTDLGNVKAIRKTQFGQRMVRFCRNKGEPEKAYVVRILDKFFKWKLLKKREVAQLFSINKNVSSPKAIAQGLIHVARSCSQILLPQCLEESANVDEQKRKRNTSLDVTLRVNRFRICHPRLHGLCTPVLTKAEGHAMWVINEMKKCPCIEKGADEILETIRTTLFFVNPLLACEVHALCRMYASVCRLLNKLDVLVMLLYTVAFDQRRTLNYASIYLTCYTVWPSVASRGDLLSLQSNDKWFKVKLSPLSATMMFVALHESVVNKQTLNLKLMEKLFIGEWTETFQIDELLKEMTEEIYSLLKNEELCAFEGDNVTGYELNEYAHSCTKALVLLCRRLGWQYTYNVLMTGKIWSDLKQYLQQSHVDGAAGGSGSCGGGGAQNFKMAALLITVTGHLCHCGTASGFTGFDDIIDFMSSFLSCSTDDNSAEGWDMVQFAAASVLLQVQSHNVESCREALHSWTEQTKQQNRSVSLTLQAQQLSDLLQ